MVCVLLVVVVGFTRKAFLIFLRDDERLFAFLLVRLLVADPVSGDPRMSKNAHHVYSLLRVLQEHSFDQVYKFVRCSAQDDVEIPSLVIFD